MGPNRTPSCLVALLLLGGALVCGCPPRTVIIQGKEVPVSEAAKLGYDEVRREMEAGRLDAALAKFETFLEKYPDSDQVDDALLALGDLLYQAGQYQKAVEKYQQLVADYPQSPYYLPAAVHLGQALAKAGRIQEALPTLQSVFDHLEDPAKKAEVAGMLAESYAEVNAPVESLRWFMVLYQLTAVAGAKQAIRQQVLELIDRRMSFVQVRQALEMVKESRAKGFPLDLLQFKLAKILFHILEFERARETLEDFVADFPEHEFTAEAGRLLKRIIDRDRVSPSTIGVLLPLSGEYREYGRRALEGIQLGTGIFDEPKPGESAEGPVLVIRDTAGDPNQTLKQMEDLVYNEHVLAVIGPMVAKEAYAAAVKAQELEVPIVTLSFRQDITQVGSFVFRNFLTFAAQSKLLVRYAMEKLGVTRFAVLYPNDWYGVDFTNTFWDEVERRKGEVRAAEGYEPDAKNFSIPIKKLVGRYYLEARWDFLNQRHRIRREHKKPLALDRALEKLVKNLEPIVDFQALFVPDYHEPVAMIAPALAFEDILLKTESRQQIDRIKKSMGREKLDMVYLLGGNGWNHPQLIEWAKKYVQGAIFCDGFFLESNRPDTKLFVGKFRTSFDRDPSMIEAQAYDTARILRSIIEKVRPPDRKACRDALLQIKNFPGATGSTTFRPDGEAEKTPFPLTIKNDQILELDLEPSADAGTG